MKITDNEKVQLEDNYEDILFKAMRGLNIGKVEISKKLALKKVSSRQFFLENQFPKLSRLWQMHLNCMLLHSWHPPTMNGSPDHTLALAGNSTCLLEV